MKKTVVVKIQTSTNNAHDVIEAINGHLVVNEGWALVPDGMRLENFPFGTVEAEEIDGVMTVTRWTAGEIPVPPEPPEPEPSEQDRLEAQVYYTAMMTDTLLEGDNV